MRQPLYGLYVLRKDIDPRVKQHLNGFLIAQKVRRERLDSGFRILMLGRRDDCCVVRRTPITEIISVD